MFAKVLAWWKSKSLLAKVGMIFAAIIIFLCLSVIILELFSRNCRTTKTTTWPSCTELNQQYAGGDVYYNNLLPMKDTRSIDEIVDSQIFYVPQEEIGSLNGITCSPYAYVSKDMSGPARRHVAIHEAIHLTGEASETKTELRAIMKDPFGFPFVVVHTVFSVFEGEPISAYPCVLGRIWKTFKVYFLGSDWSSEGSIQPL